jgi:hypothetical protein
MSSKELSAYEVARLERIKANEDFLKSIGLYKDPNEVAAAAELKRKLDTRVSKPRKKKNYDEDQEAYIPETRRSSRNSKVKSENEVLTSLSDLEDSLVENPLQKKKNNPAADASAYFEDLDATHDDINEEEAERKVLLPAELRRFIDSRSIEHSDLISKSVSSTRATFMVLILCFFFITFMD